jgi:hypothetical protein
MPNQIDLPACASLWTEQDRTLYNKLDFYLAKTQVDYFKRYNRWQKVLSPIKWSANQGPTMKGVRKVRPPILRGQFLPNAIDSLSKKDVIEVRETSEQVKVYKHRFESQLMQFLPSFQDFMNDHVDKTNEGIVELIAANVDIFYRTAIFHGSPNVWIAGKKGGTAELTGMQWWQSPTIALSKTAAELKANLLLVGSNLSLKQISKAASTMELDLGVTPYSGGELADGTDGKALTGKYLLITSSEVWNNFPFDSFLQENRQIDLNIVTQGFTGSLWGRITAMFERFPMRLDANGNVVAPETVVMDANSYANGDTVMNPDYVNAPFEVAFLCGAEGWKSIQVGPPPKDFASGEMSMKAFRALDWNGKVQKTKDVMVNCLNEAGAVVQDLNKYGEYLQLISQIAMGILPIQRKNIVPIIFARQRVGASVNA